jgi:hypothetical protein
MVVLTLSDSIRHFLCTGNYRMALLEVITHPPRGKLGLEILQPMKHYTNYVNISNVYLGD